MSAATRNKPQYYAVEFIYTDNGQIFGSGALLTKRQVAQLKIKLRHYEVLGAIEQWAVYVPKPVEQSYSKLVAELKDALQFEVPND